MPGVHQTVITAGTDHFNRKDAFVGFDLDLLQSFFGLSEYLLYRGGPHFSEVATVHGDNRAECARAQAVHGFEREFLVGSCLPSTDAELAFELLGYHRSAADVAGGAETR